MALSPGEKLGPYEILEAIGKGGMGEVYRARDARLNRDVAIKISAERFTERFEREGRAIAALNDTNVCHLYDVGPNYLVMELVEGPTLADRLGEGPIPLEEALVIARQIADALEAAHQAGVTHRDLKPGNIKIKPDGTVKVLDFGLAKLGGTPTVPSDLSPTISVGQTEAGVILGTAAYMSPEQAKGKTVDQRSDIYAFGLVLYEMVTGTRLHRGDTTTEVLASVLREEPDWNKVPPQLQRLLRRCLEKDPQKRQRHIGDVMALVDDAPAPSVPAAARPATRDTKWLWMAAVAVLATGIGVAVWAPWRQQTSTQAIRFEIQPTAKLTFFNGGFPMVSPNGKWVVLPATGEDGVTRMYLRALDSVEMRPMFGTESGNAQPPPVIWSPDSRFIAFASTPGPFSSGQLKKLDISGGAPITVCDLPQPIVGGTWNRDGVILFASNNAPGLLRVSAAGGVPTLATSVDRSRGETNHRFPQFLPDGRHFLYLRVGNREKLGIYLGSLDAKPEEQSLQRVLVSDRQVMYRPSLVGSSGLLLILRDTTLFAQPFDLARFELTGEPVPVADQVGSFAPATAGLFSVSETGVLAYRVGIGGNQTQLTWFDPQGKAVGTVGDKGGYVNPALSPDGSRVAVTQLDRQSANSNIWVLDVARGGSIKVTFKPGRNDFPVWSPDGKTLMFSSNTAGRMDLYLKSADGSGEERLVLKSDQDKRATSWSRDGRFLLYQTVDPKTGSDVWVLPDPAGAAGNAKPVPYLHTELPEGQATFSPDGRWVAHTEADLGNSDVFVRPFYADRIAESAAGGKWLVSKGGAVNPRWRGDGKELYYSDTNFQVMAVDIRVDKTLEPGAPRRLFAIALSNPLDVTADGKRFIIAAPDNANAPSPFAVVTNWQAALTK